MCLHHSVSARGFPSEHHHVAGPPSRQSGAQDQQHQTQRLAVCWGRDVCGNAGPKASVAKRGECIELKGYQYSGPLNSERCQHPMKAYNSPVSQNINTNGLLYT